LKVPSDGFYQFEMESDDGSVLQIDDEVVVDNDGNHGSQTVAGQIPLRQGYHKLRVKYYQSEGGAALRVNWANSGSELKPLAGSDLFH
jgi:hexosaminidase